jgi:dTDP-4-dehydrorhamnose 3,5-epimerase
MTIKGIKIFKNPIFIDKRGFFREVYKKCDIQSNELIFDCTSLSKKNVVRGLHMQTKKSQAKFLSVIKGEIYDVAVDLRSDSETFGHYSYQLLTGDVNKSFWIPKGFAHGFQALSEDCLISYSVTNDFSKEESQTINPLCPRLNIEWPIVDKILSFNDSQAKNFNELLDQKIFFTNETVKEG